MDPRFRALVSPSAEQRTVPRGTELTLWFAGGNNIELTKTLFRSPSISEEICAVRGKTAGAYSSEVTFQWTSAVQALSTLLLKAAAMCKLQPAFKGPLLEGGRGSMAASLDASIYKQTAWLDLFGSNIRGDSLSRSVLKRTNPGMRRNGPVAISLNTSLIPPQCISINIDSKLVNNGQTLMNHALNLEDQWDAQRNVDLVNPLVAPRLANPLAI